MTFLFCCLVGVLIGSFGNSVVYRVPEKLLRDWRREAHECLGLPGPESSLPLENARSFCPHCHHTLAWYDLFPLLSWVRLGGRCRYCKAGISLRYPLLELSGGGLAGWALYQYGLTPRGGLAYVLAMVLLWLSVIDLKHMLLPDRLVYPLLWLGLLASLMPVFVTPTQAISGVVVGYAMLALPMAVFTWWTGKEGMGGGDVKLLAALGAYVGPSALWKVVLLASLGTLLVQGGLIACGRLRRTDPVPFGPALAGAGLVVLGGGFPLEAWMARLWY